MGNLKGWQYVYDLTARRRPACGRYLKLRPPGLYLIYRPPRDQARGHLAGIAAQNFAAMASNESSKSARCAFQAPCTVLVLRPARLVGAVVTSSCTEVCAALHRPEVARSSSSASSRRNAVTDPDLVLQCPLARARVLELPDPEARADAGREPLAATGPRQCPASDGAPATHRAWSRTPQTGQQARGGTGVERKHREQCPRARRRKPGPPPRGRAHDVEHRRPGRVVEQQAVAAVVVREEAISPASVTPPSGIRRRARSSGGD